MGRRPPEDEPPPRLFDEPVPTGRGTGAPPPPLAERMRPRSWDEILGQEHLTAPGSPLRRLHESGQMASLILWGPPGSGKTTLAALLSDLPGYSGERFSAVLSGVKEVREVVERARKRWDRSGEKTVLFVDEIHRFNRAQQDAFLPHVESGRIVLLGATTENPSFEVIPALLSRCAVHVLRPLTEEDLRSLGINALADAERGLGATPMELDEPGWQVLLRHAAYDARRLLNTLEMLAASTRPDRDGVRRPTPGWIAEVCERPLGAAIGREEHFDLISALHKSLRGSDPHAALYWLARMLESGEDPRYVVRRMIRFASEDVGLADPAALHHAVAAMHAYEFVGSPEGHLALAQAAVYLALCPKSNALYASYGRAAVLAKDLGPLAVPLRIRNAPTPLMDRLGYGRGYRYAHDEPGHWVAESYLPDGIPEERRVLWQPSDQGREREIAAAHRKRTGGFYEGAQGSETDSPDQEEGTAPEPGGDPVPPDRT